MERFIPTSFMNPPIEVQPIVAPDLQKALRDNPATMTPQQLRKLGEETRETAQSRRKILIDRIASENDWKNYQDEVQTARQTLVNARDRLPEDHRNEVDVTVKALENIEKQITDHLAAPPATPQRPEDFKATVDKTQRDLATARTPEEKMNVLKKAMEGLRDSWLGGAFFGFLSSMGSSMKIIPFMKNLGEWAQENQDIRHIHQAMRETLNGINPNLGHSVRNADTDIADAKKLKGEFDIKTRLNQNLPNGGAKFADQYPTLADYAKARMLEVHNNPSTSKSRYNIRDIVENINVTPQQQKKLTEEANKTAAALKADREHEQLDRNEPVQKRYALEIARALMAANFGGITEKEIVAMQNINTVNQAGQKPWQQIAERIANSLRGKNSNTTATGFQLYLHQGTLHEHDLRRRIIFYWNDDDPIPGGENFETTLLSNPRAAAQKLKGIVTDPSYISKTATGYDQRTKTTLLRISQALTDSLISVDRDWTSAQIEPPPTSQNAQALAAKQKSEVAAVQQKTKGDAAPAVPASDPANQ